MHGLLVLRPSLTNSRISNIYEAFTVRHKFGGVLNRNVYVVWSVVRHFTGRNIVRISLLCAVLSVMPMS